MQAAAASHQPRLTGDGLQVSASQIQRLEKKRKAAKDNYDSLKINQLTNHGKEDDPARRKKEDQHLVDLRRQIKTYEAQILEIKLSLKDSIWVSTVADSHKYERPDDGWLKYTTRCLASYRD